MLGLTEEKLLGVGHVVLNTVRALNIVGLFAVMFASMLMAVLSGVKHEFFFFDAFTHIFVFILATFLFISEFPKVESCGLWRVRKFFDNHWPVLAGGHTLALLGWAMVFMGFQILGDLVKPAYTLGTIELPFWRAIVASAILSITFGFFNIIGSLLFRLPSDKQAGLPRVTSRQVRMYGSLARGKAREKALALDTKSLAASSQYSSPPYEHTWPPKETEVNDERPSNAKRITQYFNQHFRKSRGPAFQHGSLEFERGHHSHSHDDVERGYSSHGSGGRDRSSPIVPNLERPPTALHPINMHRVSHGYSEAHFALDTPKGNMI
ncbi:hypothetical protein N0V88_000508 [Collariella sp. IMI 366227]|nr:hypothetical protein N0V88_000508 [Collariella sp. IMI 366227]